MDADKRDAHLHPHHSWAPATSSQQQSHGPEAPVPAPQTHTWDHTTGLQAGAQAQGIMVSTKDNDSESCYWLFSKRNSFLLEN